MALPRSLDLDLLRGFVEVARTQSFSRAGETLLRSQSTISLQIQRLEDTLGRRLLERSPRAVRLTPAGATFLPDAQRLLALNDDVLARAAEAQVEGHVRLGTPEDFATAHLQDVLARFVVTHPAVTLEVTCDLTLNLLDRYRQGAFDLVLVKREPQSTRGGTRVWREPLVWVSGTAVPDPAAPLRLAVSPEPCVYRKRATAALTRVGRPFRIAYTCGSLAGTIAAVRAGLGVTVLPHDMVPPGLARLDAGLPRLAETEIALLAATHLPLPARLLRRHIVQTLETAGHA